MAEPLVTAGVLAAGYALGMLPTALVVGRRAGHDPTVEGSGNPGASNVFRTAGSRAGAVVLTGDLAKGALAAGLGLAGGGRALALGAGLAAVVGHVAPAGRRGRGGKGMATAAGALAVTFPVVALLAAVAWLVIVRVSGLASVGSLVALAVLASGVAVAGAPAVELALVAGAVAVVAVRHAGNVGRLWRGDERRLQVGPVEGVSRGAGKNRPAPARGVGPT